MSHVDEGTLHAYLDGELSSAERAAVDAHLGQCGDCRTALAEARALLERATALLGSAAPRERPAPPFEELRPKTASQRSPWRVIRPLAWAASIVLAVGLGYYLRTPPTIPAPTHAVATEPGPTAVAQTQRRQDQQPANQPPPAVSSSTPRRVDGARREDAHQLARQEPAATDTVRRSDSALNGVVTFQPPVALRNATPAPASVGSNAGAAAARLQESEVRPSARVADAAGRRSAVPRDLVATTWPVISRGTAASLLGEKPVGLPGLATREIRRSPGPDSTVMVEQSLDASTVIRIYQRPVAAGYYSFDSSAAKTLTDRLARYVGRLRVEISGPLSADSLNRLLEQVEPLP